MGMYDTYGETQLKVGECLLCDYMIGDKVEIPDGVYVAPDGIVVIANGVFVAELSQMFLKWGQEVDWAKMAEGENPIAKYLDSVDKGQIS